MTAAELHRHGSVWAVVPRDEVLATALALAGEIAAKDGYLLRLAKAAINGIDPVDVHRSYRFEQGFTFEANLSGVADRHRDAFAQNSRNRGNRGNRGHRQNSTPADGPERGRGADTPGAGTPRAHPPRADTPGTDASGGKPS